MTFPEDSRKGRAFLSQEQHEHTEYFGEQGITHRARDEVRKVEGLEHMAKGVELYSGGKGRSIKIFRGEPWPACQEIPQH